MSKPKAPKNTKKTHDPADFVMKTIIHNMGRPKGSKAEGIIERQEVEGQRSFTESDTLPVLIEDTFSKSGEVQQGRGKQILELYGIKFHNLVDDDPLFRYVTLPDGWKKVATDHSMWSNLVDASGRVRAAIFYKAAFYDRRAALSLRCRFHSGTHFDAEKQTVVGQAFDGNLLIHTTEPIVTIGGSSDYKAEDRADAAAKVWLDQNLPWWRNPEEYWD